MLILYFFLYLEFKFKRKKRYKMEGLVNKRKKILWGGRG